MIGIRTTNDVLNGIVKIFNNSDLLDTFSRAFIEIKNLGLSEELNAGSTPTLSSFLSPNSVLSVDFYTKIDEVIEIEYTLLSELNTSGLSYTVGDNLVYKTGIYNLFSGTDYIYIDQLYLIDKSMSSADYLFLVSPIEAESTVYKAYYLKKCITVLFDIPCKLKSLTFAFNDTCCNCEEEKVLAKAYNYLEAIQVQQECNDCVKQNSFLKELKKLLKVC